MDAYIRDYHSENIETKLVNNINEFNNASLHTDLKFFHMNIRSINKNMDELSVFLSQFDTKFDLIILSECWKVYDLGIFHINGYDLIYNEGNINKNDGVIIFIRCNLEYNYEIKNIGDINVIKLEMTIQNEKIIVSCLYRPPSTCPYNFNRELIRFFSDIKNDDTHIFVGDTNINIMSENDYEQEYLNILHTNGFISYINNHTRIQGEQKTCIDHYFIKTSQEKYDFIPLIFQINITDHFPIILLVKFKEKIIPKTKKVQFKEYLDHKNLKKDMQNEDWSDFYSPSNDLEQKTKILINKIKYNTEKNTNLVKIKTKNINKKEWITKGLVQCINKKNHMYEISKKSPNNEDLKKEYKIYKNKLNQLIKNTKKQYFKNMIDRNKNTSKNLWDAVNILCKSNKTGKEINKINTENGDVLTNKKQITNEFNNYYSTLGEKYANKITCPKNYQEVNKMEMENSMYLTGTTEAEIIKIISELKKKKAPGHDDIRAETLIEISGEISAPLSFLINSCFKAGYFPEILKIGIIKPMFKGGDTMELSNYRPISLITNIAKIFEKVIKTRIIKFLEKYKIISDRQFGFREGLSTEDAIAFLTSKLYDSLDKSKPALVIFLDLAKAFDTVCHKKLLHRLQDYGFRGNIFNLLKSYLSNRVQYVKIENEISFPKIVQYGVPQGTVLGPILFTIYMNNVLQLNISGTMVSFADDTAILYTSDTWTNLKNIVESDLKRIKQCFDYNLLTINYQKTKYLPFSSYANGLPNFGNLKIDNSTEISESESIKYLGIIIDRHMRWDLQINSLVKKLRGLLSKFKYLKNIIDQNHLKTLYYALVQTQLTYGIIGWGGVADVYLKNLDTLQKWILKIIYDKDMTYPTEDLFRETEIFDLRQLFCLNILTKQQKNKNKMNNIVHNYDTRSKQNSYQKPRSEKVIGQKSYTYLSPRIYEKIPQEVKNLTKINQFKRKIKNWLLETPRIFIHNIVKQKVLI